MADEINVKVILDPSQVQAGSDDVVAAVQAASNDIVSALGKVTTSSNSASAAIRSGFAGVEGELKAVSSQIQAVAAAVQQSGAQINATLNQIPAGAGGAAGGLGRVGHAAAGVRREFIVLGHEIATGNWTRFGGSLMVLGERMDFLRYLTGTTGVGLGVLVGGLAAVTVAAVKGAEEISHLENELVLTGNAAGLTQDKFLDMAHAIASANTMISTGNARDAVSAVAGTGAFGPQAVQAVSTAVAEISRLSGENAQKVAQDFARMSEGVYKWANDSKEAKNLVSAADAEYVRQLEEQGRVEEAEIYLAQRISERLQQVQTDLGILPSLWNEVKDAASAAWDAMMNIGRPDTLGDQIQKLEDRKKTLQDIASTGGDMTALGGGVNLNPGDTIADLDRQIAALKQKKQVQDDSAAADARQAELNREGKEASERLVKDNEQLRSKSALEQRIAQYESDIQKSRANGGYVPSQKEQSDYIAYLTKLYNSHEPKAKTLSAGGADAVSRAEDNGELALLKDRLSYEQRLLQSSYKDGEITLQQYYDARMRIVRQGMEAELAVAQRSVTSAESAATHAGTNPNAQQEAAARVAQAKNRVALLNQQLQEQESQLTAEMQEQQDLQDRKLAQLREEQNLRNVNFTTSQAQRIDQLAVQLGQATNAQLIQQEMQLENQRYQVALQGLQERLGLQHQTVEQQQQINSQIEQLEQQHQSKMTELQIQAVSEQTKTQKQAMDDFASDIEQLSTSLVTKPQQWRQAFGTFFSSLDQQLVRLSANSIFKMIAGPGTSAGGTISGLFGQLFGGATGNMTSGTQTIGSQTVATATVPMMTVGTMTVGASVGGGGGGLSNILSGVFSGGGSFAGDFGFSSGMEGSTDAVMGGLGAGASEAGASDMSALFGLSAYATGTPYVPQTQLALIHRGEAIIPAAQNTPYASGGMSVTNNFNLPGKTDLRTQQQMAGLAGMAIQTAMRRNG